MKIRRGFRYLALFFAVFTGPAVVLVADPVLPAVIALVRRLVSRGLLAFFKVFLFHMELLYGRSLLPMLSVSELFRLVLFI